MLFTGGFISAEEARERGLVNRVVPAAELDAAIGELAAAILAKTPVAIRLGKAMFYRQVELGLEGAYDLAAQVMADNMMSCDAQEGIDAFIAKRAPNWQGR